jgi:hypothetical protein
MIFSCIFRIFLISILVSAFAVYSSLDEFELMAYRDILKLKYNKQHKYLHQFLQMKLKCTGLEKMKQMIKYKENRVTFHYLIMKKNNLTINQFYEKLLKIIESSHHGLSSLSRRLDKIYPAISNLSSKGIDSMEIFKDSRDVSYRTLNLINIIRHLKFRIEVKCNLFLILVSEQIKCSKIITYKKWRKMFKEWYVLFYMKRRNILIAN